MTATASAEDRLADLGYTSEFKRDMSPWANFSLGFTYLSPVVSTYTLFGTALALGGPPMIWSFVVAGVGQFLVALVFGELVAQYPVAGGVYPWARRLWGKRWAWMTGWVYLMALLVTIASVSYGAGPYLATLLGYTATVNNTVLCAIAVVVVSTLINYLGTRVLSWAAIFGFAAEIIGALAVGIWLLVDNRVHNIGVIFDSFGAAGSGSYLPAFFAAGIIGLYQYYGFEACGDTAEEVEDPGRVIPKAMRRTIYIGGAAATFACLSLLLAVPDFGRVISGEDTDPVTGVLTNAFGTVGYKVVIGVVLISFLSCTMSLQAAASRLTYSYARDKMLFGHKALSRFSPKRHIPPYSLLLAGVVPVLIVFASKLSTDALNKIVSFATLGIYLGFQMVVFAALRARLKGWVPSGEFTLGRWGLLVNVLAFAYGVAAMVNMCWPRTPDAAWYDNYVVLLSGALVVVVGGVYMAIARPFGNSDAAAGDAVPQPSEITK
ncbi:amino acid permease [Lentzea tibetensis]|uniref:Amino acid permease n=1 Tax=Lentzea tibetensis TaxID=2591470 RepID=A0A563EM54_9PSEU|nr:APC family permease [Lentzea tibetensis]TWP48170.1 amino acid permease [Lentzea tibetensis]